MWGESIDFFSIDKPILLFSQQGMILKTSKILAAGIIYPV